MSRRYRHVALLLALLVAISGCAEAVLVGVGAAGGAGAVLYVKGKMVEEVDIPFSKAHTAAVAALKDLELPIKKDTKKGLKGKVESQYPDGKFVWVNIRGVTESSSKISVRVGVFGDKAKSKKIFDAIHQHI
jgi:hypothetical protein